MATKQSSTPSFFNFVNEGILLPARNMRLFAAVFALVVACTSLILLGNDLAVQPFTNKLNLDIKVLNGTDPSSPEFAHLLQEVQTPGTSC
ncbi:hypothetical protein PR202_ga31242 [Eleusine coracana subsp. coracana]|uniref:Uncharacterized protein n=1 Tax=Eleusine coracana subsp. coracana TaxID=191504 RepID=A0AAV5DR06_ELECO|nr:hypothetical protein PR202_ga31242 [Eleusine coracana subsp. coracana]